MIKFFNEKLDIENNELEYAFDSIKNNDRSVVAKEVLKTLRNFVERVMLKVYCEDNGLNLDDEWENLCKARTYCSTNSKYNFLYDFVETHLNNTSGHRTVPISNSASVFLSYFERMIQIKVFLKTKYNYDVLRNIDLFPLNLDNTFLNYYREIWKTVDAIKNVESVEDCKNTDIYYVLKKKPLYFDKHMMYELTLTSAFEKSNKLDRFIVFSKINIFDNYAIKASIVERNISVFDANIPIKVIESYNVAIRVCELDKMATILGAKTSFNKLQKEYQAFMNFMKEYHVPFDKMLNWTKERFLQIQDRLKSKYNASAFPIIHLLTDAKKITDNKKTGTNTLKYLFHTLKNKCITSQISQFKNEKVSNLYLKNDVLLFDKFPFCCNLKDSKQLLRDVWNSISIKDYEHQLLARYLIDESKETGHLYINKNQFAFDTDVQDIITKFNSSLDEYSQELKIGYFGPYLFMENYEETTLSVLKMLEKYTAGGLDGYKSQAQKWLKENITLVKGDEKKKYIVEMFDRSRIFLVHGPAGTGKSTLIKFIFGALGTIKKLCLAPTHPALESMMRRIGDNSATYLTIQKFVREYDFYSKEYDIVVVDECSVVDNRLMNRLLTTLKTKLLIVSGDTYQIPSIEFGNWFYIAKTVLPDYCKCELTGVFRTENDALITLWEKVRDFKEDIGDYLAIKHFVHENLDTTLFEKTKSDEIILCLNYDGLYGVNFINTCLQCKNPNTPYKWYQYTFKVGDPILFSDLKRFENIAYNNLKGRIEKIEMFEDGITFEVSIDRVVSSIVFNDPEIKFVSNNENSTKIRFSVYNHTSNLFDKDTNEKYIVPFHVSYAVSIHKSQGLEYNSVKIVVANDIEERINHNIFYTAITRAKQELTIYWTPESQKKILNQFIKRFNQNDMNILKARLQSK